MFQLWYTKYLEFTNKNKVIWKAHWVKIAVKGRIQLNKAHNNKIPGIYEIANTFLPNEACLISLTNSLVSVLKHWIRPFSLSATHSWPKWGTRAKLWGTLNWPGLGVPLEDSTEQRKTTDTWFIQSFKVWHHSCSSFQIHVNKPFITDFLWGENQAHVWILVLLTQNSG